MNRRDTVLALLALGAAPLAASAQQAGKIWRIGYLAQGHNVFPDSNYSGPGVFRQAMRELGYVEGKNLLIEWRSAEGESERLPGLAAELVHLKVDVIVASGTPATIAAQRATTTIPIIMVGVADPVGNGLVKSLARPGGNTTGVSNLIGSLVPKLLEMLLTIAPKTAWVAVLVNPTNASHATFQTSARATAQGLGVTIVPIEARNPREIEGAFSKLDRKNVKAIVVLPDAMIQQQNSQIVELVTKHRLLSVAAYSPFADAGGLMSYGPNFASLGRPAATYVDKVLKGAKPAELPVEQPTKFELVINLKTAKALGLKIPESVLFRADRVLE